MPNTCKLLPKWRNFAKSGHTGRDEQSFGSDDITPLVNQLSNWDQSYKDFTA